MGRILYSSNADGKYLKISSTIWEANILSRIVSDIFSESNGITACVILLIFASAIKSPSLDVPA